MAEARDTDYSAGALPEVTTKLESPAYLGSVEVVDGLVRTFVAGVLARLEGNMSKDDQIEAAAEDADRLALILLGEDPAYTTVGDWNSRGGIGMAVADRLNINPNQMGVAIVKEALLKLIGTAYEVVGKVAEGEDDAAWQIEAEIEFYTSLFVGTADVTHPRDEEEDASPA